MKGPEEPGSSTISKEKKEGEGTRRTTRQNPNGVRGHPQEIQGTVENSNFDNVRRPYSVQCKPFYTQYIDL